MVADLREMQENQWVSEIWIDKLEFICLGYVLSLLTFSSLTNPFFLLYSHGSFCVLPPYLQTIPP